MLWFVPKRHPLNLMRFERFVERLLENHPAITALLGHNPFADRPPRLALGHERPTPLSGKPMCDGYTTPLEPPRM